MTEHLIKEQAQRIDNLIEFPTPQLSHDHAVIEANMAMMEYQIHLIEELLAKRQNQAIQFLVLSGAILLASLLWMWN